MKVINATMFNRNKVCETEFFQSCREVLFRMFWDNVSDDSLAACFCHPFNCERSKKSKSKQIETLRHQNIQTLKYFEISQILNS